MRTCRLCGHQGPDVRIFLVQWKDQARPFAAIDRCVDAQACRYRLELIGEAWPVEDSTAPTAALIQVKEPEPAVPALEELL